ncbi:MAG: tRNA uridine-5-carboxymethylaminomethyl(34) synthesis GTPase MnmE [Deltaproteobacteria bacterium]|nr:tRNA uridine-5-carboxymethylaminomethyl(34) synthesis GTPase MnmE [Deltaproteobacteria bacterium]
MYLEDTIVAVATPPGRGAIAIVRLSGPRAIEIALKLWRPRRESARIIAHRLQLGDIRDPENGNMLDRAMCVLMRAPRSLTGENIAELHCHGGVYLVRKIVALAAAEGARIAEPGEFSRRAFLNGRIDLTEAEAIADLIDARSTGALHQSLAHLAGALAARVHSLREQVIAIRAHLEAEIDFSDQEIDLPSYQAIAADVATLSENVTVLYQSFTHGRMIREGARAAIIGKPNVGKSSILNLLLGVERAIVTAVPGTTRDLIEESVDLDGYSLVLVDTAGIRENPEEVERIGIKRARAAAEQADLLIAVFDSSRSFDAEDAAIIELVQGRRGVALLNKHDLPQRISVDDLRSQGLLLQVMNFCAITGDGLTQCQEALVREIEELAGSTAANEVVISRERHRDALGHTLEALGSALSGLTGGMPPEIVAIDIALAAESLGSITGEVSSEDVLDAIFCKFCIGK